MISIKNAQKNYEDFHLNISMEVMDGRITGLVGKNGAGKSTTIKLILGLIKADAGSVCVLGKESYALSVKDKENMGVCLSNAGFSLELNANDIKHILKKMYSRFDEVYFEKKCRDFHLPTNKKIREFSTGMNAKLRVLIALSHKASVLILDEPTSGLDIEARNDILDILREYIAEDENRSILITSHISTDLESLCDDIYLIHNGEMILHENTDVILDQYAILKVNEDVYASLDQNYIIKSVKMHYGYACFTKEKAYYLENYPGIVIENSGIDDLILMMTGGYR